MHRPWHPIAMWREGTTQLSTLIEQKGNFSSKITFNLAYLPWLTSAICDSYLLFLPRMKINNHLAKPEVGMHMLECFLCSGSPISSHLYRLNTTKAGRKGGSLCEPGNYARLKVILEEKFPFNYTYYTVAHKCRIAPLGRRAYLFNAWKMRKEEGHRKPTWTAGPLQLMLCP